MSAFVAGNFNWLLDNCKNSFVFNWYKQLLVEFLIQFIRKKYAGKNIAQENTNIGYVCIYF